MSGDTNQRLAVSAKSAQALQQPRPQQKVSALRVRAQQKDEVIKAGPFKGMGPKSRLGRQQTVTGNANVGFGSEMVIVYNDPAFKMDCTLGFDGQDVHYPVGGFMTVPAEVAFHHWGVVALPDVFDRPKGPGSQYEDRLSGYAPLSLWQSNPDEYQRFMDWFDHGVKFKVFRPATQVEAQDWERVQGESIS